MGQVVVICLVCLGVLGSSAAFADEAPSKGKELYRMSPSAQTRWFSFENPSGEKGQAARENAGAKGHAWEPLAVGETKTLMDAQGCGIIQRIWVTLNPREPRDLRAIRLQMYWDGAKEPAVSVPLGDFFGAILGRMTTYENELFSSPEGRSFNCYIPMPFRTGAKVTVTNDGDKPIEHLFYDIDAVMLDAPHDPDTLYFHAAWRRERFTALAQDFEILPTVHGKGRFLGAHVGVILNPVYGGWWGEGEVKMYLDGDDRHPTICGTGTEDYIGTGWGQNPYAQRYQGAPVCDADNGQYTFYRYHVPDAVYFHSNCRVTLQQMGGAGKGLVLSMLKKGVPLKPVSIDRGAGTFTRLLDGSVSPDIEQDPAKDGWVNFYRTDDVSAVALFYLDSPTNGLPEIVPNEKRVEAILEENPAKPKEPQ